MSALAKGIFGVTVPAAGVGGAYIYWKNSNQNMPDWVPLKSSNNDKFGKDFQPYLVDHSEESNKDWWEWSYKERYQKSDKNNLSSNFGNLENANKLKEKCQTNYDENTSTLIPSGEDAEKTKRINDIWKFCSPLGAKPKTIAENEADGTEDKALLEKDDGYKGKHGENKKSDLVSVNYQGWENNEFWKIKEKLFFGEGEDNGIGKYTQSDENKKTLFNTLYDSRKGKKERSETLKQKCGEAYKLGGSGETTSTPPSPSADDVVKYCGLKVKST